MSGGPLAATSSGPPAAPILASVKQEITDASLAELVAAEDEARRLIEASEAPSTVRAHEGDWRHFTASSSA